MTRVATGAEVGAVRGGGLPSVLPELARNTSESSGRDSHVGGGFFE
jgi:hypothetical protein